MIHGHIIFLNGTSSSGKTSLAKALETILEEPYVYVSFDSIVEPIINMYFTNIQAHEELGKAASLMIPKVASLLHHIVAALALLGKNVIVDHIITDKNWLIECVDILSDYPVTFVGVHCPLEELERRELARGDRAVGLAKSQIHTAHENMDYDLTVDTQKHDPMECAIKIKCARNISSSSAIIRMKNSLVTKH
ncbi:chloramphenicol phosphotransferase [Paenibacillus psychroresistens]|uniref:Chloramphenicol phosphotransferase n=1 Tax=Paenibacillus psychroresistens TaxID=1778678 RepID=A0A6B8RK56_9BACL|nr:AAA family ATPase [Paenibacillus psychroresistens]QGQ96419.1 chloramphenicol phosphotransferase [Paenibacillus psychroresistens]